MIDKEGTFDQLNDDITKDLFVQVRHLRENVLSASGKAMRVLLFKRLLDLEFAGEEPERNMWIKVEDSCAPLAAEDSGVSCYSFMLENPRSPKGSKDRLRILAPVPDDFDRSDLESIAHFPEPAAIFVERISQDRQGRARTVGRYLVSREVSYEYDPDAPLENFDDLGAGYESVDVDRLPQEFSYLGQMLIHMARWKTRPQRRRSVSGQLIEL